MFDLTRLSTSQIEVLQNSYPQFLQSLRTLTARGTFYNDRKAVEQSAAELYKKIFEADRGTFALSLMLPGVTEFSQQLGVFALLSNRRNGSDYSMDEGLEKAVIAHVWQHARPQKVLTLLETLKKERVNNSRTRKLALRYILNSPKLEFWSVKYRSKLKNALIHCWDRRHASIVASILKKHRVWTEKEKAIIQDHIDRFVKPSVNVETVRRCVGFILGDQHLPKLPLHKAFVNAKSDFEAGRSLPYEVLEGLRSTYHPNVPIEQVLDLTKQTLTTKQKANFQRKATKEHVDVEFDPMSLNLVDLYVYSYEMGLREDVHKTIAAKAKHIAKGLPQYEHVGVLLDVSQSMLGHKTQQYRPIAAAQALCEVLRYTGKNFTALCSDENRYVSNLLEEPKGHTSLAGPLIELLKRDISVVYIISDGYENAPAGRVNEVINAARKIGVVKPIFHINPVVAAEREGTRQLSDKAPVIGCSSPESLPVVMIEKLLEADVIAGIQMLADRTLPALGRN